MATPSRQEAISTLREGQKRLDELLARLSDEEWLAKAPYQGTDGRDRLLATLLGFLTAAPQRLFGHVFAHLPDLEAYVRSVGSP